MSSTPPADDPGRRPGETAETRNMTSGDPLGAPEAPTPPQQPPPSSEPRRLLRSRTDRVLGGVCAGVGRYVGVDPVVVRIAAVVLAFIGGAGILLYLAAVLLVPEEAPGTPPSEPLAGANRNRGLVILGAVLVAVVLGPIVVAPAFVAGGIALPLAVLVLLGLGTAYLVTGRRPASEPAALVRAAALGLGVLALAATLAIASFWTAGLGGGDVIAGIVVLAGVAVLAGAFLRPVRWLIVPALAIALPAAFVAAAGIDLHGGVGDKTYRPGSAADLAPRYEIGAGALTLDLRAADLPAGDHDLEVSVGMGEAVIIVPDDVCVATDADLGMGGIDVFDRSTGGIDFRWIDERPARAGTARLVLDADVGLGHLEIRNTADDGVHGPPFERWGDHRFDEEHGSSAHGVNAACASA